MSDKRIVCPRCEEEAEIRSVKSPDGDGEFELAICRDCSQFRPLRKIRPEYTDDEALAEAAQDLFDIARSPTKNFTRIRIRDVHGDVTETWEPEGGQTSAPTVTRRRILPDLNVGRDDPEPEPSASEVIRELAQEREQEHSP